MIDYAVTYFYSQLAWLMFILQFYLLLGYKIWRYLTLDCVVSRKTNSIFCWTSKVCGLLCMQFCNFYFPIPFRYTELNKAFLDKRERSFFGNTKLLPKKLIWGTSLTPNLLLLNETSFNFSFSFDWSLRTLFAPWECKKRQWCCFILCLNYGSYFVFMLFFE